MRISGINTIKMLLYLLILFFLFEYLYSKNSTFSFTKARKNQISKQVKSFKFRQKQISKGYSQRKEDIQTTTFSHTTVFDHSDTVEEDNNNVLAWKELTSAKEFIMSNAYARTNYNKMSNMTEIKFLQNYKNPCWYEKKEVNQVVKLKCLPYFYVAGVEKCGTTDLFFSLITHDQIVRGDIKEPHYWSKGRFRLKGFLPKYMSYYTKATHKILMTMNRTSSGEIYHPLVTLDSSADTFLQNFAWKKFSDEMIDEQSYKRILTPFQIRHIAPGSKFVIILRNPSERLYSSYNYFPLLSRKPGLYGNNTRQEIHQSSFLKKSPDDFHERVMEAINWFSKCTKIFPNSQKCFFWNEGEEEIDNFINHLQMGFYGPTLLTWLKAFPLEHFKFVRLEDYSKNKIAILNEIFEFLELPPVNWNMRRRMNETNARNMGLKKVMHGPMLEKTRTILSEFYKPFNKILVGILQDSRYLYT